MDNKKFLLREKKMLPASELLAREPDKKRWLEKKRKNCVVLSDGRVIRDQKPFNRGVEWEGGISESEFLKLLNEHVFFWTKADVQRQTKGGGFSKKYQDSAVVVVSFADIIRENPNLGVFLPVQFRRPETCERGDAATGNWDFHSLLRISRRAGKNSGGVSARCCQNFEKRQNNSRF